MRVLACLAACLLALPAAAESPISGPRQLTFEGKRAGEGYFSADGTKMIFQSERAEGNPFYQMYLLDLETGDVSRLSSGVGKTTCGWIHPSGEKALFSTTRFDPEAEAKMQAEIEFRESGQERRYAWDYDPTYEIVSTPLEGGEVTRLTDARGYDAEASYSPDGERIVFASNRAAYARELSEEEAAQLERDPAYFMDLYVMDADGTNIRRLTDAPGYDGGPFWNADGTKITWRRFSEDGARAEVFTINPDGTGERQITDLGVMSWAPFFHPSGEYIVFSTNLEGFANFELYLVDAEGKREPVRVTDREGFDGLATFTPDGTRISWTSNATGSGNSQIFLADWDHEAARALVEAAPRRAGAAAPPLPATRAEIAPEDLRAHVEILTADAMAGRLTGTEGARRATAYVAEAFAGLGLDGAGPEGFFHPFDFTSGVALAEGNRFALSIDGTAEDLPLGEAWRPMAFSAAGETGEAGVVFAGYGLVAPEDGGQPALDSYAGIDVEDAWVLVWRGMPAGVPAERRTYLSRFADRRYKASVAASKGARGVILAPPPREGFDAGLPKLSYEAASGSAKLPVVAVDRATGERMLSKLGETERTEMIAALEDGEAAGTALIGIAAGTTIALDFERREGRNVLARLDLDGKAPGEGRPPFVIGAHVDHLGRGETSGSLATGGEADAVHPGADDNASGVAAMIEVAERLAAMRVEGALDGARDVVFAAWSGEELGLLGVNAYVEDTARSADREDLSDLVSAYLNMDMVGRLDERLVIQGVGSSPVWPREIERRNAVVGLPVRIVEDTYLPTDATAFYLAGVPMISLFTGAHEDYHRPSDTADKLNYDGLADIARFVALVARSRAMEAEEPEYLERTRPDDEGGGRMAAVFLGTIPDYAEEGVSGVPLSGVVKGGPAEAAGLSGGDVVVSLAGQDLANIYDYVRVLNGLKPGEEVAVTVSRDGEEVETTITPRARN